MAIIIWTLRKTEENKLIILEKKILRKIFGPVKDEKTEGWNKEKQRTRRTFPKSQYIKYNPE